MSQIRKGKRKVRYGRVLFLVGVAVLIVAGVTFAFAKPSKYKEFRDIDESYKTAGVMKEIIQDSEETKAKFYYYPEFENASMNKQILDFVNALPNEDGISFLDYESDSIMDDAYTSIKFTYKKLSMEKQVENESTTYMNFKNTTGNQVSIKDVFRRDYEDVLSAKGINVDDLANVPFYLGEESVAFLGSDKKEITIKYSDYKNIIRLKGKGIADEYLERERTVDIDPKKPMIALTFDDGPSPYTEEFMNVFKDNGGTATFFMLGQNVIQYPDVVKQMYKDGFEIANHSWDHLELKTGSLDFQKSEIFDTQDAIFKLVGDEPSQMRPPYGSYDQTTLDATGSDIGIAIWNVDTLDWQSRDASSVLEKSRAGVADGAVVLYHDLYPTTLEAIKQFVPELKAKGYQLVSFSDIVKYRGEI